MPTTTKPASDSAAPIETLLDELAARHHPAAAALREAWAVDLFLRGHGSVSAAAALAGVPEQELRQWLRSRGIAHLLDVGPAPNIAPVSAAVDVARNGSAQPASVAAGGSKAPAKPQFTVVLPIYNEQENIPVLYPRLVQVLEALGDYEIIFVNDGSHDRSVEQITDLHRQNPRVRLISFSRNFGHQAAVSAGIDHSRGDAVMLMDADLQDPPEILSEMVAKWRDGFEVVYAVREKRQENIAKKSAYFLFYRLLHVLADIDIPLDSGDFCLMDRKVVDQLKGLPERNRFLRGLRSWVGFRQTALPYERQARHKGEPKYTFKKLVKLALDGLVSFSSFPLRLAAYLGFVTSLLGVGVILWAVVARLTNADVPQGWASQVALLLMIGGIQLLVLGVLGEYVARIYEESKQRPTYIVAEYLE